MFQPRGSDRHRPTGGRSLLLVIAGLIVVACTGADTSGRSAPTAPTGSDVVALAPDAQRYTAIVAPLDPAIDTFSSKSGALPASASVDDFVSIASPFASIVAEADNQLRRVRWPAVALPDIKAELAADDALVADLTSTTDVTLILAVWRHQVLSAARKARNTKRAVNIDFGLLTAPAG